MVVSEIWSLYSDDNDLLGTVIKRVYEQWNERLQQWDLLKIEFNYEVPDYPLRSDNPGATATAEERHGWVIPPEWRFISEVWEYERKPVSEVEYDHEADVEVRIIRE